MSFKISYMILYFFLSGAQTTASMAILKTSYSLNTPSGKCISLEQVCTAMESWVSSSKCTIMGQHHQWVNITK